MNINVQSLVQWLFSGCPRLLFVFVNKSTSTCSQAYCPRVLQTNPISVLPHTYTSPHITWPRRLLSETRRWHCVQKQLLQARSGSSDWRTEKCCVSLSLPGLSCCVQREDKSGNKGRPPTEAGSTRSKMFHFSLFHAITRGRGKLSEGYEVITG